MSYTFTEIDYKNTLVNSANVKFSQKQTRK